MPRDEIKQILDCRYIGPSEACHRILDFDYTDVSLQFIAWKYIDEATAEPGSRLLAYFECVKQSRLPNAERPLETSVYKFKSAKDLTYSEMPSHYVYKNKKWNMRKKN